jgi:hypothetical protein
MMKQTGPRSGTLGTPVCQRLGGFGLVLVTSGWASVALAQDEAPTKASCAQAYESAQESRASGHLQQTRERLSFCARPECPGFVQKDCARWLEEVDKEIPSVVLNPVGLASEAAGQVSVKLDGELISGALNGAPLSLDPGRHELVLERPGQLPLTRTIMAQQGVQNRSIEIRFDEQPPSGAPNGLTVADASNGSSALRPYAYAAWGVGALGLGVFAVLGTLGRADEQSLKDDCPVVTPDPAGVTRGVCLQSTIDDRKSSYRREFRIADVGLVAGLVGAASGTVLFFMSAGDSSSSVSVDANPRATTRLSFDVSPLAGGAFASVHSAF